MRDMTAYGFTSASVHYQTSTLNRTRISLTFVASSRQRDEDDPDVPGRKVQIAMLSSVTWAISHITSLYGCHDALRVSSNEHVECDIVLRC